MRKKCLAATLVELLVVIGILLLLAAVSFPAYRAMMARSYEETCASNLRHAGIAISLYREQQDSAAPIGTPCQMGLPVGRGVRGSWDELSQRCKGITPMDMEAPSWTFMFPYISCVEEPDTWGSYLLATRFNPVLMSDGNHRNGNAPSSTDHLPFYGMGITLDVTLRRETRIGSPNTHHFWETAPEEKQ